MPIINLNRKRKTAYSVLGFEIYTHTHTMKSSFEQVSNTSDKWKRWKERKKIWFLINQNTKRQHRPAGEVEKKIIKKKKQGHYVIEMIEIFHVLLNVFLSTTIIIKSQQIVFKHFLHTHTHTLVSKCLLLSWHTSNEFTGDRV